MRFLFACFLFLPQQWSMVFSQDVTWEIKNRFDPTDESDQSIHISIMRSQADGEASFTYSVKGKGGGDTAIEEGEKSDEVTLDDGVVGLVFNVVLQDDLHPEDDEVVVVTVKSKEGRVLAAETIIIRDNDRDSSNTTSSSTTTTTTTTTTTNSSTSTPTTTTTTTTTTKPLVSEEDTYAVVTDYDEISESDGRLTIYLTRSPGTGTGTVTFSVRGGGGKNSAVEDESREISFGAVYIIPIDVSDDNIQEEDEPLTIIITENGEVKATKIIIVKDDDIPTTTQPGSSTTVSSIMTSDLTSPSTSTSSTTTTTMTTTTMPTSSPTTMPSSSSTTSYSTVFTSSSTMSTTTDKEYFKIDQPAVPLTESSTVITIKYEFKGKRPKDFTITVKGSKSGNPFSGVEDKTEIIHFRGTGTEPSQGGIEIKLNDDTVKDGNDGFTITVTDENGKEWNKIFIPIKDND